MSYNSYVLFNFRKRTDEEVESGKGQLCQRNTTTGQPALKKKRYIFFDQLQFLLPIVGDENKLFLTFHLLKVTRSMGLVVQ